VFLTPNLKYEQQFLIFSFWSLVFGSANARRGMPEAKDARGEGRALRGRFVGETKNQRPKTKDQKLLSA
jgi:hypothetical protein